MNKVKLIVGIVVVVLLVVVMALNWEQVEVKFLLGSVNMPKAVLLFVTLLIGILIGAFTPWRRVLTLRRKKKS